MTRAFLICTISTGTTDEEFGSDGFYVVEEVTDGEGGFHQSVERHCNVMGEFHRPFIRPFFPELEPSPEGIVTGNRDAINALRAAAGVDA